MVEMRRGQYSSCPMIFEDVGCRSPSLQTAFIVCPYDTEGLKAPGYSCSRLPDVFEK